MPAVIVSPYARPDFVTEQVYDHTSVLALIERKWNLPPLTAGTRRPPTRWRRWTWKSPPHFLTPPVLPRPGSATETAASVTRPRGRSGRGGAAR